MKRRFNIPEDTRRNQALAADPTRSVWVSANAGSGKTHVLSRRVIRLLLDDVEPSKILCLTYTKAAAANMANRVFAALSAWTSLDEEKLAAEIEEIEDTPPTREKLRLARQLFARALETPGGLKIQTIHAFCESILHQFPLEANIAGHFELLDPLMEAALVADASRDMITSAAGGGEPALTAAFQTVLSRGGENALERLISECVAKRDPLRAFLDELGHDGPGYRTIFSAFGIEQHETRETIAAGIWPLPGFSSDYFEAFAAAVEATDARSILKDVLPEASQGFSQADPELRLGHLAKGLLDSKGDPYKPTYFKKALVAALPDLVERYEQAAAAIRQTLDRLALYGMLEATAAALTVADRLIGRYEALKSSRGFLDFNDLIVRTVRLLGRQDAGAWVQYKLDRGIDHILVDEAQDTSPDQWRVIRGLAEEFFSGSGARDNVRRTVFAVGDEKQSIYSFQGADPRAFAEAGHTFGSRVRAVGREFNTIGLRHSFRSTEDVLAAVDRVFAAPEARKGLTSDDMPVDHPAIRAGMPGAVEVWSSLGPTEVEEPDDWTKAIDHTAAPAVRLADAIAATIGSWLEKGEMLPGKGRPIRPGDIMILVRRRDRFVHAVSRALKTRRPVIPVAGADRLSLQTHIAVKDLMALGRVVLQRDDDLSLAALLRSPVFGLSDDELFAIAWERGEGVSLFEALRRQAADSARLADIMRALEGWRDEARSARIFDFYSAVLGRDKVQQKLVARLGSDTAEILDEFLNFCLAEEKTGLPGLDSFIETLESAGPEIKRQMDQTRDEVQIMTVHAAKGLEAPVVFLVDNGSAPFSSAHLPKLIPVNAPDGEWHGTGYLWRATSDVANSVSRAIDQRIGEAARDEYRRLLYVGMTRAEDRLIVCGYHGSRPVKEPRWHSIVCDALVGSAESREFPAPVEGISVHRFELPGPRSAYPAGEAGPGPDETPPPLPDWIAEPAPPPPTLPASLSPSSATGVTEPAETPVPDRQSPVLGARETESAAAGRGTVMHRLFQTLPDLAAEEREAIARRHLLRVGQAWSDVDRERTLASVLSILDDPRFAAVFAPEARAEVSIAGRVRIDGRDWSVSGKIDRMAASREHVFVIDFKTGRNAPRRLEDTPEAHVTQMALYQALLRPIYPDARIEMALLYTEAPILITLSPDSLREALDRLGLA